mmetsp:Transcript_3718/g.8018  ORF Transcript_3718/g.8018 Transcript_3718/m.8018 type:complete len:243 (-) Transcript_3718:173-901(-)
MAIVCCMRGSRLPRPLIHHLGLHVLKTSHITSCGVIDQPLRIPLSADGQGPTLLAKGRMPPLVWEINNIPLLLGALKQLSSCQFILLPMSVWLYWRLPRRCNVPHLLTGNGGSPCPVVRMQSNSFGFGTCSDKEPCGRSPHQLRYPIRRFDAAVAIRVHHTKVKDVGHPALTVQLVHPLPKSRLHLPRRLSSSSLPGNVLREECCDITKRFPKPCTGCEFSLPREATDEERSLPGFLKTALQ